MHDLPRFRTPLLAKLAVTAAALFFAVELGVLALWMMPMIPLVPVFVLVLMGNALLLASVVEWAASQRVSLGAPGGATSRTRTLEAGGAPVVRASRGEETGPAGSPRTAPAVDAA